MRVWIAGIAALAALCAVPALAWEHWGGDAGGTRFSPLSQITPDNTGRLIEAWTFHTGDLIARPPAQMRRSKFEATPLLVDDSLIFCTPFNEVVALDPSTGRARWRYDPGIPTDLRPGNRWVCRGVTHWRDDRAAAGAACASRIFMGTNDARVIALDAKTGQACADFGKAGEVKLDPGAPLEYAGEFQITSPPVVARDVVVVGSAFADNRRVEAPPGIVRAFDARTGAPRWSWDPLIRDGIAAGHANVWAPMTVDDARGLVFLPTSSPSPDFFGGKRPGDNKHANSVVALKIETGELAWAFQTVHHDVWDYDVPAQPTLARIDIGNGPRDVVIQATKMGFVFVLDRDSGQPLWPVEERAVPQGGAPGELLSPTQPYPTHVPPLLPQRLDLDKPFGVTFWDRKACGEQLTSGRYDGLFTPPSTDGALLFPMTGGGVNWGGVAYDPVRQIMIANTSRAVHRITLIPRAQAQNYKPPAGTDFGPQRGAPLAMTRALVASPLGMPCNPPPWGAMVAVDLKAGKVLWESKVGTTEDIAPLGIALNTGTPLVSGVLATAGGVIFTGAMDSYLRAFDASNGRELWQGRLPVPGVANPMTYAINGEQYVVIGAGGHSESGTSIGDSVVAFRLPRDGEAPSLWSLYIDRPGGRLRAGAIIGGMALVMLMLAAIQILRRRRMGRAETR
ncbi:pyrroloquinoline quinone-dependent dehydrogenase [Tardiphaga sp.]|jgi:quinoprotein glucose dehydrogenase|uniref:pyrroloquinoline quinone-dependent dehydrogenase n=1 Tax=Tardiphaga sp. TaxID=1926292 RepID=UPI0037D998AA